MLGFLLSSGIRYNPGTCGAGPYLKYCEEGPISALLPEFDAFSVHIPSVMRRSPLGSSVS
jgi:hypothetical protein